MRFGDLVGISAGNLWRMKLRSLLTIAGVVIAIGAFVAMLSFGAGNRRIVTDQVEELDLLFTMQVYPRTDAAADSTPPVALDQAAVARISALSGVDVAYPFETFDVTVALGEREVESSAQALSAAAVGTRHFSRMVAGRVFDADAGSEIVIDQALVEELGCQTPDSMLGLSLIISRHVASLDSGLVRILNSEHGDPLEILSRVRLDSLMERDYLLQVMEREVGGAIRQFIGGLLAGTTLAETLTVRGVIKDRAGSRRMGHESVLIPEGTARRFAAGGVSADPLVLFEALQAGRLFQSAITDSGITFPRVTLKVDRRTSHAALADSIEAMGFRSFSFAEQFDQMRRMFLYFDLVLAVVGLIALLTASLGIANTMVMSIGERRREIGILKSLGADDRDVRTLFLVESGVIGCLGSAGGILLGWLVARVASKVAQIFMERQGIDPLDPFATPLLLVGIAFLFGIGISVLAGAYPAARASRVDPVNALRRE